MSVLLDTGILIRLLNEGDAQHPEMKHAIAALDARRELLFVAAQSIAELWNVCTRPRSARGGYGLSIEQTTRMAADIERLFEVLYETSDVFATWRELVITYGVRGVQVHDTRLVAHMLAHGIQFVLTSNPEDFRRFGGRIDVWTVRDVLGSPSSGDSPSRDAP